ncbi:Conserved_hypothetical protein [Hexamita inflata]|uniref:MORN repeat protein n=1 Tax=Hexamita inflata TaxID=28002 RepID=A0AA86NNL5_9EUKA|nr:Conserved hypothetical protein [Hexamita inflata]
MQTLETKFYTFTGTVVKKKPTNGKVEFKPNGPGFNYFEGDITELREFYVTGNGTVKKTASDGSSYLVTGPIVDSMLSGQGVRTNADGTTMTGDFKNNLPNGQIRTQQQNNQYLVAIYENGRMIRIVEQYVNDTLYKFDDNTCKSGEVETKSIKYKGGLNEKFEFNGNGCWQNDTEKIECQFEAGKKQGNAKITTDKGITIVNYLDDKPVKYIEATCKDSKFQFTKDDGSEAKITSADYTYQGQVQNLQMHGKGCLISKGIQYDGNFINNIKEGDFDIKTPDGFQKVVYQNDKIVAYKQEKNKNGVFKYLSPDRSTGVFASAEVTYVGGFDSEQKYHGKGKLDIVATKQSMECDFINGQMSGTCVVKIPSGDYTIKQMENNKEVRIDQIFIASENKKITFFQNGLGKIECAEYEFEGEIQDNLMHGKGLQTVDKQQYAGIFQNNLKTGKFIITQPGTTNELIAFYENDTLVYKCSCKLPDREVVFTDKTGKVGTIQFKNSFYEGQINSEYKAEGNGTMKFDTFKQEGSFKNEKLSGLGSVFYNNGDFVKGEFTEGAEKVIKEEKSGDLHYVYTTNDKSQGTITGPDFKYTGQIQNGQPHGNGQKQVNNITYSGKFVNGHQMQKHKVTKSNQKGYRTIFFTETQEKTLEICEEHITMTRSEDQNIGKRVTAEYEYEGCLNEFGVPSGQGKLLLLTTGDLISGKFGKEGKEYKFEDLTMYVESKSASGKLDIPQLMSPTPVQQFQQPIQPQIPVIIPQQMQQIPPQTPIQQQMSQIPVQFEENKMEELQKQINYLQKQNEEIMDLLKTLVQDKMEQEEQINDLKNFIIEKLKK